MAFRTYTLTLTGVAQRLSDVYGDGLGVADARHDIPYRQLLFQAVDANTHNVFFGMDKTVSGTNFGFHLDQPSPNIIHPPIGFGPFEAGPIKLGDVWVLGTNGEQITIAGIPF